MEPVANNPGTPLVDGLPAADEQAAFVAAVNAIRASANLRPQPNPALPVVTWDPTVAAFAQNWANGCPAGHNPDRMIPNLGYAGENMYFSSFADSAAAVVNLWAGEACDYDYANNACSNVCGHYTQLVWRDSITIGCGVKTNCTGQWPVIVVCDFVPGGNYVGQQPY